MENRINILEELAILSPVVSTISNHNIFSVPIYYFSTLPQEIIFTLNINSIVKKNPYSIPEGYFNRLPTSILHKIGNQIGDLDITSNNSNTYYTPIGYFDGFASSVLKKIKSIENHSTTEVFAEIEGIAPLLSQIDKINPYSVPEDYFNSFSVTSYEEQTQVIIPSKIISLGNKTRKWIYYAIAASVSAIMFLGGYSYFSNEKNDTPPTASFPQIKNINIEQSIANLSDDDINNYLNNQATLTDAPPASFEGDNDLQNFIDNTSDEEIQQYLNQNSEPGEKKS